MMSSLGVGALVGSVTLAATAHRPSPKILIGAAFGLSASQIVLASIKARWLAMLCLAFTGWMMVTFTASANSTIQVNTPDYLRGRVMSVYSLVFGGVAPIGSLFSGYLSGRFGARVAFAAGGIIGCAAAAYAMVQFLKRQEAAC